MLNGINVAITRCEFVIFGLLIIINTLAVVESDKEHGIYFTFVAVLYTMLAAGIEPILYDFFDLMGSDTKDAERRQQAQEIKCEEMEIQSQTKLVKIAAARDWMYPIPMKQCN